MQVLLGASQQHHEGYPVVVRTCDRCGERQRLSALHVADHEAGAALAPTTARVDAATEDVERLRGNRVAGLFLELAPAQAAR